MNPNYEWCCPSCFKDFEEGSKNYDEDYDEQNYDEYEDNEDDETAEI